MNTPLRRVGAVVLVLFGLLFVNLNWVQGYKADEYRNHGNNARVITAEYQRERGRILVGPDGIPVAVSVETDGRLRYLRTYPEELLYAHVVGYEPVGLAAHGLEAAEDDFLSGVGDRFLVDRMRDLFTGDPPVGGTMQTTLLPEVQRVAFDELSNNQAGTPMGSVVALDPRTGAVQAMVSLPAYDPNPLAGHDQQAVTDELGELGRDPDRPLVDRAVRSDSFEEVGDGEDAEVLGTSFHPGSVFKVITAAAVLQNGLSADSPVPGGASYTPPTGGPIGNAPGVVCPDPITLEQALVVSCNTAFARLAAEELGGEALRQAAADFGFGDGGLRVGRPDGDSGVPVSESLVGDLTRPDDEEDDPPTVAQSAIGQASVQASPMLAAMIAATVANGGEQMRPYLVQELRDAQLRQVYEADPERLRTPVPGEVAEQLQGMMVGVVERGTGTSAAVAGATVGGKTGTAEGRTQDAPTHGWFIGFAIVDGEPVSAVAVMLESAGDGGSREAARIAGEVLSAAVAGGDG